MYIYVYINIKNSIKGFSGDSVNDYTAGNPEFWVRTRSEDSLEEGMATHSNILAWGIP